MVEFYLFGRIVNLKDVHSGEVTVLYDAKKAISKLNTPVLEAPEVPIILKLRSQLLVTRYVAILCWIRI